MVLFILELPLDEKNECTRMKGLEGSRIHSKFYLQFPLGRALGEGRGMEVGSLTFTLLLYVILFSAAT